jgi:hypothetical protein
VCHDEALQTISSRIEPAIHTALQHVPLGTEMASKDLKRHIFSTLQVMIEGLVRKEIEAWIRRTLKGLEPLRKVITDKIHRLINVLYALPLLDLLVAAPSFGPCVHNYLTNVLLCSTQPNPTQPNPTQPNPTHHTTTWHLSYAQIS